jgi:hypothetical protein
MATGSKEPPFKMKDLMLFKSACLAFILTMRRSRRAGVQMVRRKVGPAYWFFLSLFSVE